MKTTLFSVLFLVATICTAQSINQFDANGKRHGKWQKNFKDSNALRYKGQFEHGKEVGTFTYYQKIGKVSKVAATKEFNPNNNIAVVTFLSLKGKIVSQGKMDGKKYIDKWVYYHKNSNVLMTTEFYNASGKLEGKKTIFYDNGNKAEETNYVDGKFEGDSNYYSESGALVKTYKYKNNELHGDTRHYNEDGSIAIEGQYQNGHKHGWWKYYKNGEVYNEKDFTRYSKNPKKKKN